MSDEFGTLDGMEIDPANAIEAESSPVEEPAEEAESNAELPLEQGDIWAPSPAPDGAYDDACNDEPEQTTPKVHAHERDTETPKKPSRKREIFGQIVCILLVLSLLGAMVATELSRSQQSVTRRTAVIASYTRDDEGTGYLVRDESVITTMNAGTMSFAVPNGATVVADTLIANVYGNDTGTDERAAAAELYRQIALREAALAETENAWTYDYVLSYTDLMSALATGDLRAAQQTTDAVSNTLVRRDTSHSEEITATLRAEIEALYAEIEKLILHEDKPEAVLAGMQGVFYRDTDGYERIFDVAAMDYVTPSDFKELVRTSPTTVADTVGRVIGTDAYYLVFPIAEGSAAAYTVNSTYNVRFSESGLRIPLTLERIATDASGEALLILRGTELPEALLHDRRQNVAIERETLRGLRIPLSALSDKDTVFIEENGEAKEIKVTPIVRENGCCLLALSESADALKEGDRVLLGARRIYNGKVVS